MLDDWYVRVEGKEYGPVDLDTLREWKSDGHLIPTNEVRRESESAWVAAGSIEELFPKPSPPPLPDPFRRRRTLVQIVAETCRSYARGFFTFVALAAMVGVPSLGLKLSMAFIHIREGIPLDTVGRTAAATAILMVSLLLVAWPLFIAGIQFATAELAAGRRVRFRDILRRAKNFWPRIAQLCVITYGAFLFWTMLPLFAVVAVAAQPSALSILFALLALAVQVFMVGRLFINFLFWQQAATLGGLTAVAALQESREVARSRRSSPRLERPLYRGAIIASGWVVFTILISIAVELPFLVGRLLPAQSMEQAIAIMQGLMNAPRPDAMTIAGYVVGSTVDTLLRPLLGIAFVLLYFDAKAP